ncbi:MAG: hypothetical protein R2818_07540 [Flavobacteriales bacterium]
MALSTIQGQTPLGTTKPSNLKASIGVDMTSPKSLPLGYAVEVAGMLTNSNPGMYGMVLGITTPAGVKVDVGASGSWKTKGASNYDMMLIKTAADGSLKSSTTEYWEVWYKQSDVDSDGWSTEVDLVIGNDTHQYTFVKKRTGDGLDEELTDATLEPSGYERPAK